MDTPDETPTIAEALQRITDLAERAKREEAARQVDIMEAQGTIEALEVELLALRPKAQRATQGEEALQALVLLGWPRETGLDPLEWAKEMRAAGPGEFEVQNSIWAVERKLAAVEKLLDDAQQQRDGKQIIIDRVRATIGAGKAESLQNRLASIMADLAAHEKVIKEARDVAQEAIWPGRESRTEMSLVDLIGELAEGYKAAKIRERYIVETRAALGLKDGVTLPDGARQLVAKLAATETEARDPCSTCRDDRRAAIAERDQIAAKLTGADTDMRIFVAQIHDAQTQITKALGLGPTSSTLAELVDALVADRDRLLGLYDGACQKNDTLDRMLSVARERFIAPGLAEAHRQNLAELRGLIPSHEAADSAQVLRGAIDTITDLRQKTAGRETSVKVADMRLALDGLHDQLIAMGRKEMERWAAREREIEVFGEETARLPWTGWFPSSIYPIEVYRAVVDKVIALQAAHDKVQEDDSRVVADAAAGIERMQEQVRVAEDALAALQVNYSAAMADAAGTVERAHERIFAAAELVDRMVVWAGADERHLLGKMVLDLPVNVWADRGTAIIAAVQRARDASSRVHSWVGKVGNERCWRCHILRDSVAGTVDCPAMNKPEAPAVSG